MPLVKIIVADVRRPLPSSDAELFCDYVAERRMAGDTHPRTILLDEFCQILENRERPNRRKAWLAANTHVVHA